MIEIEDLLRIVLCIRRSSACNDVWVDLTSEGAHVLLVRNLPTTTSLQIPGATVACSSLNFSTCQGE